MFMEKNSKLSSRWHQFKPILTFLGPAANEVTGFLKLDTFDMDKGLCKTFWWPLDGTDLLAMIFSVLEAPTVVIWILLLRRLPDEETMTCSVGDTLLISILSDDSTATKEQT